MAIISLATIKSYFQTGDKPTQGQFADTWDSLCHKNEAAFAVAGAGTFALLAGQLMEKIVVTAGSTGVFKIGTSANGSQIFTDTVTAGTPYILAIDYYAATNTTVHLTGNFNIKILTR